MERIWAAEIRVDAALATSLIEAQFPALAPVVTEPLGAGWDNTVFRVNGEWVFRFPRRQIAVGLIETERRCLPVLGPRLSPVQIPIPIYDGQPCAAYPWPFVGYAYISGDGPLLGTGLDRRVDLAIGLARFLKALHTISPQDLPAGAIQVDGLARLDGRRRRSATSDRLASLDAAGVNIDRAAILGILESAPPPPSTTDLVIAHGDLYVGQLLVTERGALAAVLDWGDLHLGHAAVDLAVAHQLLPPTLHDRFLAHYGAVDRITWELARARGAWHAVALLASAVDVGDTLRAQEARMALDFIASRSLS